MEACRCCNGAADGAAPPSPARLDGGGAMAVMAAAMVREGCGNGGCQRDVAAVDVVLFWFAGSVVDAVVLFLQSGACWCRDEARP